jgi:hypothetical protein
MKWLDSMIGVSSQGVVYCHNDTIPFEAGAKIRGHPMIGKAMLENFITVFIVYLW